MKKLLSLVLVLMLALGCMATANATEITDYRTYITAEMETWCIQNTQNANELTPLSNCIDGLLTNDNHGNLIPNIAHTWGSEDGGQTWKFELVEGVQWVNQAGEVQAETIAEDWQWGMEWTLNYHKNEAINTSMLTSMVAGAMDYYTYTAGYDPEDADAKAAFEAVCEKYGIDKTPLTEEECEALDLTIFKQMVKCEAPDNYTVIITLIDKFAYFETLACYNCLYPISGKLLEQIGVEGYFGVTPETMWYNGPYICTQFVHGNEKVFTPNPTYWNAENTKVFNSVTYKMVESSDTAFQYFQTGELDAISLSQSNLMSIYNNPDNEWHDYIVEGRPSKFTFSLFLNYDKNMEDGVTPDVNWNTAAANANFRKAIMYGWNPVPYLERTNAINPYSCQNYCFTGPAVSSNSAGVDYNDLVMEKLGYGIEVDSISRYQPELAAEYKAKAIEELTAQGVTFPVEIDWYINGSNQTQLDTATVWKQSLEDDLGSDFITMNICTYISSSTQEVYQPRKHSFYVSGWGADYGDPSNFLDQITYGEPNAIYSMEGNYINGTTDPELIKVAQTFTDMVVAARAITDDKDARLDAFAEAEAYMINEAMIIPLYKSISWSITGVNMYSQIYVAYGIQSGRWVNWDTKYELYTTEEYKQFAADYAAGKI